MNKYFFEIPIYRVSEVKYNEQMEDFIRKRVPTYEGFEQELQYRLKNPGEIHPDSLLVGLLCREFGGPWLYNEIVGYLRLYLYHSQIRVEHWQHDVKRIVKSRKKLYCRKSPKIIEEINIKDRSSKSEVKEAIEAAISACEFKFKGFYLDLNYFNMMKDHVDWAGVIANLSQ